MYECDVENRCQVLSEQTVNPIVKEVLTIYVSHSWHNIPDRIHLHKGVREETSTAL